MNLITSLWAEIDDSLPGIEISPKKILRPVKPIHKILPGEFAVKNYINANFSEKETSRFEWNPEIAIQLSSEKDQNYVIVGLDMVTSRQLKLLREGCTQNSSEILSILSNKKFKASWGELKGERYTRFPRLYSETQSGADLLWYKQFYVSQHFTRKEVMDPDFTRKIVKDLKIVVPFLQWIRETVGTFQGFTKTTVGDFPVMSSEMMDW